jgi:dienelactone hydrolase
MKSAWLSLLVALPLAACQPNIESPTTTKVVVAEFDPTATPPVLPLPNNLAINPATGLLAIPDAPNATPAQLEFNAYLRTLDGFPQATPVTATFSDAIDPASATPSNDHVDGAVALFDGMQVLGPTTYTLCPSVDAKTGQLPTACLAADGKTPLAPADNKTLLIVPNKPWQLGHTYTVIVFGGADPDGIKAADHTTQVVASPTTFFMRASRPLLTTCADNAPDITTADCLCPQTGGQFSSDCHPATGLTQAQAQQLEPIRQTTSTALAAMLPVAGAQKSRANVVQVWSFSIAHGPFAVFDPISGRIPFPNDVLVDPTSNHVNLPVDASSPTAAITMGLDQLDGFSTTADATVPIDEADDVFPQPPMNAVAGMSARLLSPFGAPDYAVHPQMINGGNDFDGLLAFSPNRPLLPDRAQYIGVLTRDITDAKGRHLVPSPVMAMLMFDSPLVDMNGHSTLVGTLDDPSAAQLERIRGAYVSNGLWTGLTAIFNVDKKSVAAIFTYKTQSITKTQQALAAYPSMKSLPTAVTILDTQPAPSALGADVGTMVFGTFTTHVALNTSGTLDLAGGYDTEIPFLLITPKNAAPGGAPVVISQHGFEGWRGSIREQAELFNAQGWAVIGIDINFHGARTICTSNSQCASGGTCDSMGQCTSGFIIACSADSDCVAGDSCSMSSHTCGVKPDPNGPLCLTYKVAGSLTTECNPAASGAAFLNLNNPFAIRDNFRQHTLDLAQLERVITSADAGALKAQLAGLSPGIAIDNTHTSFLGISLGALTGANFLAVTPAPLTGVLNVDAGNLVDIFLHSQVLKPMVTPLLKSYGIMGTVDNPDAPFYQLANTLKWVVDPGDPINYARYIATAPFAGNTAKKVIVQEAGMDEWLPNPDTEAFAREIGLPFLDISANMKCDPGDPNVDHSKCKPAVSAVLASMPGSAAQLVSTFFPTATHAFFNNQQAATAAGRTQALTWITSDGQLITPAQ